MSPSFIFPPPPEEKHFIVVTRFRNAARPNRKHSLVCKALSSPPALTKPRAFILFTFSAVFSVGGKIERTKPPIHPPTPSSPPAQLSLPISPFLDCTMESELGERSAFMLLQSAVGAVKIHLGPYTTWTKKNATRKVKKGRWGGRGI